MSTESNVRQFPVKEKTPKRYLVTHTDLDGIGCAILAAKCYPNLSVNFVDYKEVNELIVEMLGVIDPEAKLIITDLSVSEELASILDKRGNVELIDHHPTASFLIKYPWALVLLENSATKNFYRVMSQKYQLEDYEPFVELVNNYDTWGGGSGPSPAAKDLNQLFQAMGRDAFGDRFIRSSSVRMTDVDQTVLALRERQCKEYIDESLEKVIIRQDPDGFEFAIVAAEQFTSEVGHRVLEAFKTVEYVMIIDLRDTKISLRGRGTVHVGELAKSCGGGGHKKAAGFPLQQNAVATQVFCCGGQCELTYSLSQQIIDLRTKAGETDAQGLQPSEDDGGSGPTPTP